MYSHLDMWHYCERRINNGTYCYWPDEAGICTWPAPPTIMYQSGCRESRPVVSALEPCGTSNAGRRSVIELHRILAIGAQAVLVPALGDPLVHGHTPSTVLCTNRRMTVDHFLCGRLDSCVLTGVMRTAFFLMVTVAGGGQLPAL